jgi:hypothetical protein
LQDQCIVIAIIIRPFFRIEQAKATRVISFLLTIQREHSPRFWRKPKFQPIFRGTQGAQVAKALFLSPVNFLRITEHRLLDP